ncbi:unnamed protein product, partial [Prorocentrum cordatum]
ASTCREAGGLEGQSDVNNPGGQVVGHPFVCFDMVLEQVHSCGTQGFLILAVLFRVVSLTLLNDGADLTCAQLGFEQDCLAPWRTPPPARSLFPRSSVVGVLLDPAAGLLALLAEPSSAVLVCVGLLNSRYLVRGSWPPAMWAARLLRLVGAVVLLGLSTRALAACRPRGGTAAEHCGRATAPGWSSPVARFLIDSYGSEMDRRAHDIAISGVDRPPPLTRRVRNWPFSVRGRASRPSFLRVQVRRFQSQALFTKGRLTKGRFAHRRQSIFRMSARATVFW